jgi:hypothetical protein
MATEKTQLKNYCEKCIGITNHSIIANKNIHNREDEYNIEWKYYMIQCMGCEKISFRIETHDYESAYPDEYNNWNHDVQIELLPYPLKNRRPIREHYSLPKNIRIAYIESIEALKTNCFLLAGVGFRAVIEALCLDKKITGKNLEAKINNLNRNRLITDKETERLHAVRFLGNDSVHEMAVPKKETLYVVLEIIEHLLKNIYLIDKQAKDYLDTYINNFEEFENLLLKKLRNFKTGDDFPLAKYLEKDVRRLNGQISIFESELIQNIQSNNFEFLTIGDIKSFGANTTDTFQHFIKK